MTVGEYSHLAKIYDLMMEHVDYRGWAAYIHRLICRWNPGAKDILELACGTGSFAVELAGLGYRMICSDRSESMIEVARKKSIQAGRQISFRVADMRAVPAGTSHDAVLCLYDSLNYLMEWAELVRLFNQVKRVLRTGGIFIFDIGTERNSLDNFDERYENDPEVKYSRLSRYVRDDRIQVNEVRMKLGRRVYTEVHRQKIYTLDQIAQAAQSAGMVEMGRFANLTEKVGSENDERVHFVLGCVA